MRSAPSPPLPEIRWYSVKELSLQFNRSAGYIHRLIREHDLPRRKVREGRHPRRIVEVSWTTFQALQRIMNR